MAAMNIGEHPKHCVKRAIHIVAMNGGQRIQAVRYLTLRHQLRLKWHCQLNFNYFDL